MSKRKHGSEDIIKIVNRTPMTRFATEHWSASPDFNSGKTTHSYACDLRAPKRCRIVDAEDYRLQESTLDDCLALVENTSRPDYEASSIGWHPKRKRKEMSDGDMRYIIVRRTFKDMHSHAAPELDQDSADLKPDAGPERPLRNKEAEGAHEDDSNEQPFAGFLSFMLTHEAGKAVLYIYEIHLTASTRGCGLGKYLMTLAEDIGRSVGVEACMLTVFVANAKTVQWYHSLGYEVDESSPTDKVFRGGKVKESDYLILSKSLLDVKKSKR